MILNLLRAQYIQTLYPYGSSTYPRVQYLFESFILLEVQFVCWFNSLGIPLLIWEFILLEVQFVCWFNPFKSSLLIWEFNPSSNLSYQRARPIRDPTLSRSSLHSKAHYPPKSSVFFRQFNPFMIS